MRKVERERETEKRAEIGQSEDAEQTNKSTNKQTEELHPDLISSLCITQQCEKCSTHTHLNKELRLGITHTHTCTDSHTLCAAEHYPLPAC